MDWKDPRRVGDTVRGKMSCKMSWMLVCMAKKHKLMVDS